MKIIRTVSTIIRSLEYSIVLVIGAIFLASLFRYLMRFGFVGPWLVGYPFALVILPILLTTHHYRRVFNDEPETLRFWKALGLALLSALATYALAFKALVSMFPAYNHGPGP